MSAETATATRLSEEQRRAWRMLNLAHGRLVAGVERALAESDLPPLAWFDVLDPLTEADEHMLRPRDLGCGVQISRSGLTRLLDRMEAAGAVTRNRCDEDRRGSYIGLTESGAAIVARMREVMETELSASFEGQIDDDEARQLTSLLVLVATDE